MRFSRFSEPETRPRARHGELADSRSRMCPVLICIALLIAPPICRTTRGTELNSMVNEFCPVMTDMPASAEWSTMYRGQRVNFCCNDCLDSFREDPFAYAHNLSGISKSSSQSGPGQFHTLPSKLHHQFSTWMAKRQSKVVFIVLLGTLLYGCWRFVRRIRAGRQSGGLTIRPVYVELLVFGLLAVVVQLLWTNSHLEGEVIKGEVLRTVHHATYYDHGYPPTPPKPVAAKRLAARFYRGNDERSEFLFNGGNYLTATMDIAIESKDGTQVAHGDQIDDDELSISFVIQRPEHSPDRLYADSFMDRIYLTQEYGPLMGWNAPIRDRIMIEQMDDERTCWQARYPLGVIAHHGVTIDPATVSRQELLSVPDVTEEIADWFIAYRNAGYPIRGRHDLSQAGIVGKVQQSLAAAFTRATRKGIVYVCEANYVKPARQMGARFHYGIQFEIFLENGRVLPGSDLWMGSLSRSQKEAKRTIPEHQWLSQEPLPIVPHRQELSDELLGIDDYRP